MIRMFDLRAPTKADIPIVAEFDRMVFDTRAHDREILRQFADLARPLFQTAWDGAQLIGYGIVLPSMQSGLAWFVALGTHPSWRRKGVGRAIADNLFQLAAHHGILEVRLTVAPHNLAAINLYESLGYVRLGSEEDYFGVGQARVIMRRTFEDG
jgi:[ribosomal protein S18]-alanine N-acetyltransferase